MDPVPGLGPHELGKLCGTRIKLIIISLPSDPGSATMCFDYAVCVYIV